MEKWTRNNRYSDRPRGSDQLNSLFFLQNRDSTFQPGDRKQTVWIRSNPDKIRHTIILLHHLPSCFCFPFSTDIAPSPWLPTSARISKKCAAPALLLSCPSNPIPPLRLSHIFSLFLFIWQSQWRHEEDSLAGGGGFLDRLRRCLLCGGQRGLPHAIWCGFDYPDPCHVLDLGLFWVPNWSCRG